MKSLALAVMILSTTLTSVCAAEKLSGEKLNWVMTSVHDETVECWAYFGLIETLARISDGMDVADLYKPIADAMSERTKIIGKIINITDAATITKFMFSLKTHERTIDGNPANFPSLIIKNKDHCNNSYENYESRIVFYTDQYEKKFKN